MRCEESCDATRWTIISRNLAPHHRWADQGLGDCLSAYYLFQSQEVEAQEAWEVNVPVFSVRVKRMEEAAGTGTRVVGDRKDQAGEDRLYAIAEVVEQGAWGQA